MVAIPPEPAATMEDIVAWDRIKKETERLTAPLRLQELALRNRIVRTFFPQPKEGTNTHELNKGWQLKYKHAVNRDVNYELFQAMGEQFEAAGLRNAGQYLRQKWELDKKQYNTLTEEERHVFDQCLTIKVASPQIEIVLPAKAAKAQAAVEALAQAHATGVAPNPPVPGIQL